MPNIPRHYATGRAPSAAVSPSLVARRSLAQAGVATAAAGGLAQWQDARDTARGADELLTAQTDIAVSMQNFFEMEQRLPRTREEDGREVPAHEGLMGRFTDYLNDRIGFSMGLATSQGSRQAIQKMLSSQMIAYRTEAFKLQRSWEVDYFQTKTGIAKDAAISAGLYGVARDAIQTGFEGGYLSAEKRDAELEDIDSREAWQEALDVLGGSEEEITAMIRETRQRPDPRLTPAQRTQKYRMGVAEIERRDKEAEKRRKNEVRTLSNQIEEQLKGGLTPRPQDLSRLQKIADPAVYNRILTESSGLALEGVDNPAVTRNFSWEISQLGIYGTGGFNTQLANLEADLFQAAYIDKTLSLSTYERFRDQARSVPDELVTSPIYLEAVDFLYAQIAGVPSKNTPIWEMTGDDVAYEERHAARTAAQEAEMAMNLQVRMQGRSFDAIAWARDHVRQYRADVKAQADEDERAREERARKALEARNQ